MIFLILLLCLAPLHAQTYTPGETYFGKDSLIEYQAGNIPLIISVPHGGHLTPANLPDRNCEGCVYGTDVSTQELAREIRDAFARQTGCYPHMVYNRLHRKKLDMNRDSITATDSNSITGDYWRNYHDFIDSAKARILTLNGKGLFIDLHGHGHTKQRTEFGYLLTKTNLLESDSAVNTSKRINVSSVKNLVGTNRGGLSHAELIRGEKALGTLFANRGYPGVPSMQDPFPLTDDDYFNGGYNTYEYGSRLGGTIDAIQMELYSAIRTNATQRAAFADDFATVLRAYLQEHYFPEFNQYSCQSTSVPPRYADDVRLYPNPASDYILINGDDESTQAYTLRIVDMLGRPTVADENITLPVQIDVSPLPSGSYHVLLISTTGSMISRTIVVL
ncbi:MAG: T9SS type A sorting domain-containing protein [Candidatus Kapabacteria bacterium]|nr:T9SS type A sorting domain-containing protein [Candidatus Kapabacteria bacterium]